MYKHKLRKKVFEQGQWRTKIMHTDGELGSDIKDKNGREMFEGDKAKYGLKNPIEGCIVFAQGRFNFVYGGGKDFPVFFSDTPYFEVVGHAED